MSSDQSDYSEDDTVEKFKSVIELRNKLRKKLEALKNARRKVCLTNTSSKLTHGPASNILQEISHANEIVPKHNAYCYEDHETEIAKLFMADCDGTSEEQSIQYYGDHETEINRLFSMQDNYTNSGKIVSPCNVSKDLIVGSCNNSDSEYLPDDLNEIRSNSSDFNEMMESGRKRKVKADPKYWKRQKNQLLRMKGKSYEGFGKENGKIVQNIQREARRMGPMCNLKMCLKTPKRQCLYISEENRRNIFNYFWNELDWNQRKIFVINHVKKEKPLRSYKKGDVSNRQVTMSYYLTIIDRPMQVCKTTFLSTLGLRPFTVRSWVQKGKNGMIQHKHGAVKPESEKRRYLSDFLDSLPKLPSHYGRKYSSKLYLQTDIRTHTQLYQIYKESLVKKENLIASRKLFDEIFHSKNLSIFTLKKDKCDLCESYRNNNTEEAIYLQHIIQKNRAREEKEKDKNSEFTVLAMDLQAVKMAPYLTCSGFYYKTKLCCHNFSIYNLKTHQAQCYWFTECDGDLTASTFVSCLIDYLTEFCAEEKYKIIIYSDGCTYQNRNVTMANGLLDYAIKNKITIEQKYLEVGHTQNECDSVHATVERKLKNREIHLPSEYATITKEARKKPFPYETKVLDYTFFKNYALTNLYRYPSIRPGKKKGDPCVTDIKCIQYYNGKISVKLNYDEEFQSLPHKPKQRSHIDWPQLYSERLKIKICKWKHLQELKFALPRDTHQFYDSLPHDV